MSCIQIWCGKSIYTFRSTFCVSMHFEVACNFFSQCKVALRPKICVHVYLHTSLYFTRPTSPYGNPTVLVNPQTGVTYCCRGGKEHHYDRLKLRKKGGGGSGAHHHHHHHHHHHQGHPSSTHTFSSATAPAKTHKVYTIFLRTH